MYRLLRWTQLSIVLALTKMTREMRPNRLASETAPAAPKVSKNTFPKRIILRRRSVKPWHFEYSDPRLPGRYVVVSLNYCSQNGGNVYRAPYYNGNPNIGPRTIGNLDQSPCNRYSATPSHSADFEAVPLLSLSNTGALIK